MIEITTSKTGKHGHAKANITGIDIFTGKKVCDICPTSHNMTKPVVSTKTYSLVDIDEDGFASLMDGGGNMKEDVKCPDNDSPDPKLGTKIREAMEAGLDIDVTVTAAMGQEAITNVKVGEEE